MIQITLDTYKVSQEVPEKYSMIGLENSCGFVFAEKYEYIC